MEKIGLQTSSQETERKAYKIEILKEIFLDLQKAHTGREKKWGGGTSRYLYESYPSNVKADNQFFVTMN